MDKITFEQLPKAVEQLYEKLDSIEMLIRNTITTSNIDDTQPLTTKQAAEFLSLATSTVYRMAENRQLPHFKHDRRLYFVRKDLIDWLESGRKLTLTNQADDSYLSFLNSQRGGRGGNQ